MCLCEIKNKYGLGIHTKSKIVESAFIFCRDILIRQFEETCASISFIDDAFFFMRLYSKESIMFQNGEADNINQILHTKQLCKNVFLELTKANLKGFNFDYTDQELFDKLSKLTFSLSKLSQQQYIFYLNNNKGFQVEIYDDCYDFTINNSNLYKIYQYNLKNIAYDYLKGSLETESQIIEFIEKTKEIYREAAESFYELVTNKHLSDIDNISEKQFIEILSSEKVEDYDGDEIIDLSMIVNRYNDSEFLQGLILRSTDVSLKKMYQSPHTANRTRSRPILQITVDNQIKYFTTPFMAFEAIAELTYNEIPFNVLPKEWHNAVIKEYAQKSKDNHDSLLDDLVERHLKDIGLIYLRNATSINNIDLIHEPSTEMDRNIGEIDFIFVDSIKKIVFVSDTKYLRTKYDFSSAGSDMRKFVSNKKSYNDQLYIKFVWIKEHILDLEKEFSKSVKKCDLNDYSVSLLFITNAPTLYRFFAKYPIVPVSELRQFVNSK